MKRYKVSNKELHQSHLYRTKRRAVRMAKHLNEFFPEGKLSTSDIWVVHDTKTGALV